jgi:hypothetical protein
LFGRKMRDPHEMRLDSRFDYMVGRMVGASEMMAHYMALHGDEKAQAMSERVFASISFFFVEEEGDPRKPGQKGSEATMILPPRERDR